ARSEYTPGTRPRATGGRSQPRFRFRNRADPPWQPPEGRPFELGYEAPHQTELHAGEWASPASGRPLVDYLPARLSTVARLRIVAPSREGTLHVRPLVHQGPHRLDGDTVSFSIHVTAPALSPMVSPRRAA